MADSIIPERIILKGNNPDQSRKRSVYFLLLVTGRQIASTANSEVKKQINNVLSILEVSEDQENWILKSSEDGHLIVEVPKSNFKFYQISRDDQLRPGVDNQIQAKKIWIENILTGKEIAQEKRNSAANIFSNLKKSGDKLLLSIAFPLIILTILFLVKGEYFDPFYLNLFILCLILFLSLELLNLGQIRQLILRFGFSVLCGTVLYFMLRHDNGAVRYAKTDSSLVFFSLSSLIAAIQTNAIHEFFYKRIFSINIVCQLFFSTLLFAQVINLNADRPDSNPNIGFICGYMYIVGFLWLLKVDDIESTKKVLLRAILKISMVLLPLSFAVIAPIVLSENLNFYVYIFSIIAMLFTLNSFVFFANRDMPIRFLAASLIPILGQLVFAR